MNFKTFLEARLGDPEQPRPTKDEVYDALVRALKPHVPNIKASWVDQYLFGGGDWTAVHDKISRVMKQHGYDSDDGTQQSFDEALKKLGVKPQVVDELRDVMSGSQDFYEPLDESDRRRLGDPDVEKLTVDDVVEAVNDALAKRGVHVSRFTTHEMIFGGFNTHEEMMRAYAPLRRLGYDRDEDPYGEDLLDFFEKKLKLSSRVMDAMLQQIGGGDHYRA